MAERDGERAEQQGDGQPENLRELQDSSGGSALAGKRRDAAPERPERGAEGAPETGQPAGGGERT